MTLTVDAMDLTARQAELADAALRIVAREGLAAVTFRSIAAESGWSLGAVQKAFATKDAILTAMFARLRASAGRLPASEPGRPTLRAWLVELLLGLAPLDAERRTAALHGAAFGDLAAYDAVVGRAIAASDAEIRGLLAQLIRRARAEGELDAAVDPDAVAWGFLALAQGVTTQLLYDPADEASVRARVNVVIGQLLRG